ncbi:MAG TPA: hypothetical protein VKP30_14170 [Polyangiaceae bacterium]|nr:hypothetical protein [Polyangiaceae bacterium]
MATRASTFKDSTGRYSLQVRATEVAIPEYSQGHRYQRIRAPLPRRYRKHSICPIPAESEYTVLRAATPKG